MCVIVDANSADELVKNPDDFRVLINWMMGGGGKLAICSELADELLKTNFRRIIASARRSGCLLFYDFDTMEVVENIIAQIESNDHHIIALAIKSGCRLFVTHDKALKKDLRKKSVLPSRTCGGPFFYRSDEDRSNIHRTCNCRIP